MRTGWGGDGSGCIEAVKSSLLFFIIVALGTAYQDFALAKEGRHAGRPIHGGQAAPRLIQPSQEEVALEGKETLRFRWSSEGNVMWRKYYDFRIYKGYSATASSLIYQKRAQVPQMEVPSNLFSKGQIYTWSVRKVDRRGFKSRRNFASFKII